MSGGHFNYAQHRIEDIASEIDTLILSYDRGIRDYDSPETINRFRETAHALRRAAEMAQRIDWLVSGDDGEESFPGFL